MNAEKNIMKTISPPTDYNSYLIQLVHQLEESKQTHRLELTMNVWMQLRNEKYSPAQWSDTELFEYNKETGFIGVKDGISCYIVTLCDSLLNSTPFVYKPSLNGNNDGYGPVRFGAGGTLIKYDDKWISLELYDQYMTNNNRFKKLQIILNENENEK